MIVFNLYENKNNLEIERKVILSKYLSLDQELRLVYLASLPVECI